MGRHAEVFLKTMKGPYAVPVVGCPHGESRYVLEFEFEPSYIITKEIVFSGKVRGENTCFLRVDDATIKKDYEELKATVSDRAERRREKDMAAKKEEFDKMLQNFESAKKDIEKVLLHSLST